MKFNLSKDTLDLSVNNTNSGDGKETLSVKFDYDLEIREQAEARNHRIGTTNKVTYVDLVCEGTVDDNILKSLRQKINIATQIMGEEFKQWLI